MPTDLALYLHIPFCTSKCGYCDFNSYEGLGHLAEGYTNFALLGEIDLWAPAARDFTVRTVFFGGGTPSLTAIEDMRAFTNRIRERYHVDPDAEWSLEANPGELTRAHLEGLRATGINRLSIGIQSLHDDELAMLERGHSAARAIEAVAAAREAGFDNLNMDRIFGLIGQPLGRWQDTLERALELGPEHLSCYALTVEPGTALYYQVAKGQLPGPTPTWSPTPSTSGRAGASPRRATASTNSRTGRAPASSAATTSSTGTPHPTSAWAQVRTPSSRASASPTSTPPTATSRRSMRLPRGARQHRRRHASSDRRRRNPDEETQRADAMILGLRLLEGVSSTEFAARFGLTPDEAFPEAIARHLGTGLLTRVPPPDGDRLRLTPRGLLLSNEVFVDLLPDPPEDT
ncbi:MAG: coproporphyrinogen-III oxidase family protein [Dehalococcoidia bacterium]